MRRHRGRITAAALLGALLLAACGGGSSGSGGAITTAPGTDSLVSQDHNPIVARNSPAIAVNPTQPTNMVIVDRVDRPDYTAGVHVTNNGGGNWQDVGLKLPAGNKDKLFAPAAAYDGKGTLYVSYVTLSGPGNSPDSFWVARSGDGGLTFDEPSAVAGPFTFQTSLAADPKTGRLFASWLQSNPTATMCLLCFAQTGLPIMVTHSDDGGRSWSPPAQVSDPGRARVGGPALAVDPDGNPAVLYYDYGSDRVDWENTDGTYDGKSTLVVARSTDKGLRFEPGRVVDANIVPTGRFLVYLPVSPGFAIGKNGHMIAAWADGRSGDADVLLRRSTDGGKTWSKPVQVNRGTKGDGVPQDFPAIGIAPGGRIDVVYYDRTLDRRGTTADVLLSSSSDGGASFSRTVRVNLQSSNRRVGPDASPFSKEADFGTHIAVASLSGGAVAVWTDTRNGTLDNAKQDVYANSVALADNRPVSLPFRLLAGVGVLLGLAGIALFLLSRRGHRRTPPTGEEPAAATPTDVPPPPLVPPPRPSGSTRSSASCCWAPPSRGAAWRRRCAPWLEPVRVLLLALARRSMW